MPASHSLSPKLTLTRSVARVRVRSPSLRRKSPSNYFENDQQTVEFLGGGGGVEADKLINNEGSNKVMVVVDSSLEAKGTLDWALSYAIRDDHDSIFLLHVAKPTKTESSNRKRNARIYELLHSMKNICQTKKPGVEVHVVQAEGEKGPIIVEAAKQRKVSVLVLGKKKRSLIWRLIRRIWGGKRGGLVDYCIENASASCMTVAVRRKSNQLGGYLITTKLHNNFWLLA